MAIRSELTSTDELTKDALFTWAAVLAEPETAHLAKAIRQDIDGLKTADAKTRDAEEAEIEKEAMAARSEYLHDSLQRECELDVLKACKKDRHGPGYRAVFPHSFSGLIQLRGQEQERAVQAQVQGLAVEHPALAKQYKDRLLDLAHKATVAETAFLQAEAAAAAAFASERLARAQLVRTLQRTEGALTALFPGDRSHVRTFFRPRRTPKPTPQPPTP